MQPSPLTTRGYVSLPGGSQPTLCGFEPLIEEIKRALRLEFNTKILSLEDELS